MVPPETEAAYRERVKAVSGKYLAEIEAAARNADVRFEGIDVRSGSEPLHCEQGGVWVRRGEMRPRDTSPA